jgi:small subunit ribosomal protein S14
MQFPHKRRTKSDNHPILQGPTPPHLHHFKSPPKRTHFKTLTHQSHPNQKPTMSDKRNITDQKRRILAEKYELRRKLYKSLVRDTELPNEVRENARCKLADLPRNSSFTRVMNRCVFTGRARSVYQLFCVSRIVFREPASKGMLHGIKKASW